MKERKEPPALVDWAAMPKFDYPSFVKSLCGVAVARIADNDTERINRAIESLPDKRDAYVLKMRFRGYSLRQVGETMGLTKERIRFIQAMAMRKLRHPSFGLFEYMRTRRVPSSESYPSYSFPVY